MLLTLSKAYRSMLNYTADLSAMAVEGIGLHVEDILVSMVLSIIIFRILAHEENQYSNVYKILGHFFV